MTHDMPTARFFAIAILIIVATLWILASYARLILCAWCQSPYAIYPRAPGDLCRSCSRVYDTQMHRAGRRRRPLPWRLWRRAS
jgi:hypothetical protein